MNSENTIQKFITSIKNMCQEISEIRIEQREQMSDIWRVKYANPIEIEREEKEFIMTVAKQLNLELSDSFFDLGNLSKDLLPSDLFGGPNLNGSPEEEEKYWKIKKLHETISKALEWAPIEKVFSGMNCIKLAIQNCGKSIDEDIEIVIELPKESLLTFQEFPELSDDDMRHLLNEYDMSVLFGIESTAEYMGYSDSKRGIDIHHNYRSYSLHRLTPNYREDFERELMDVFNYAVYVSENKYIIKLKVDYIKHNTTVAFPTVLFIKNEITEIPYRITSKNNPNIVEGTLTVQN